MVWLLLAESELSGDMARRDVLTGASVADWQACRVLALLCRHHDVASTVKADGCDLHATVRHVISAGDSNARKEAENINKV